MAVLRRGSQGDDVMDLQTNLAALAIDVDTDGIFGPKTEAAVIHFQKAYGLDADGIAGPKTLELLQAEVDKLDQSGSSNA